MHIDKDMLNDAGRAGVIPADRVDDLWRFLQQRSASEPGFRLAHVIYYLGGLMALSAMTLFVSLSWHDWAGLPMLMVALLYAALGVVLTHYFLNRDQRLPAGLTMALAVAMTPLAVYSIEVMLGWWDESFVLSESFRRIDWRETLFSLTTVFTASLALWRYRLPLLMLVLAVASWYLLMDVLPFLIQGWAVTLWEARRFAALVVGLLFMVVAVVVDVRNHTRFDYAFWWYVVGVGSFWGALTSMDSASELGRFAYFCINLLLLLLGAMLVRRVFAAFAFLGIALYLYHLADYVFRDSLLFPVALAALGLVILCGGVYWQRHEERIQSALRRCVPASLAALLDRVQGREG